MVVIPTAAAVVPAIGGLLNLLASMKDPKLQILGQIIQSLQTEITMLRGEMQQLLTAVKSLQAKLS